VYTYIEYTWKIRKHAVNLALQEVRYFFPLPGAGQDSIWPAMMAGLSKSQRPPHDLWSSQKALPHLSDSIYMCASNNFHKKCSNSFQHCYLTWEMCTDSGKITLNIIRVITSID
jgi:hypothetical protein